METQPWPSAEDFDGWCVDMSGSPVKDEIQRRHLGLPPHLLSTSLLGWAAIAEVAEALRLSPGDTMLDVACGCGGYGLEIAARTGAGWCGWTFRPRRCGRPASTHGGWAVRRDFRLGNLAATGLGDGSVDAVLCVDAIQFSQPPDAACCELPQVLGPGGRAVLTCWEPSRATNGCPAACGGSTSLHDWRPSASPAWRCEAALAGGPVSGPCGRSPQRSTPGDDLALQSFHDDGMRSLEILDLTGRVIVTATAPLTPAR